MPTTRDALGGTETEAVFVPSEEAPDTTPTRVVMRVQMSGTRDGQDWPPIGGEITVPAFEAASLYHNAQAAPASEPVEEPEEAAVIPDETPERAVKPRKRARS